MYLMYTAKIGDPIDATVNPPPLRHRLDNPNTKGLLYAMAAPHL
jgi:hypothetical protein